MSTAIHSYGTTASLSTDDFERRGHTGKFIKVIQLNAGQAAYFTGSNYGAGAVIVATASTGYYTLSAGGTGSLAHLSTTNIHELGVSYVNVASGGPVYVLLRNQYVR